MITVNVTTDSDARTVISASAPAAGFIISQELSVIANGKKIIQSQSAFGGAVSLSFCIEDHPNECIAPYATNQGEVRVSLKRKQAGSTIWDEVEHVFQTYTINSNVYTRPVINSIETESVPKYFNRPSLFIQGKSAVKVSIDASGKYGAKIQSIIWKVDSKTYNYDERQESDIILTDFSIPVIVTVTDTRGFVTESKQRISIEQYSAPYVMPVVENTPIVAKRCDEDGNLKDDGERIYVEVGINFTSIDNKNTCTLGYKISTIDGEYTSEGVLFTYAANNASYIGVIPNEYIDNTKVYVLELGVEDAVGGKGTTKISIPSKGVFMERNGVRDSIAFGGNVREDKTFEVYKRAVFYNGIELRGTDGAGGWKSLGLATGVEGADIGRAGSGCYYRIGVDGQVHIAFGILGSKSISQINATLLPSELRPQHEVGGHGYLKSTYGGSGFSYHSIVSVSPNGKISSGTPYLSGGNGSPSSAVPFEGYITYYI